MNQQVDGYHAGSLHSIFQMLYLAISKFQNITSITTAIPASTPTHPTEISIMPNNRVVFFFFATICLLFFQLY